MEYLNHLRELICIGKPLSWQFTPPEVAMTSRTFIKQMEINRKKDLQLQLHAQSEQLNLIIVVEMCVYVKEQRRDAYYRNDPKKYGLSLELLQCEPNLSKLYIPCGALSKELDFRLIYANRSKMLERYSKLIFFPLSYVENAV